ncbi:MAG: hypothetical protein KDA51_19710, partial [Planctomycetales bacterium]|nr:hypothetical protein [Planctomycetales bacterium]
LFINWGLALMVSKIVHAFFPSAPIMVLVLLFVATSWVLGRAFDAFMGPRYSTIERVLAAD